VAALAPSRVAALEALRAVRGGALAGPAFDAAAARLDPRERAWAQELVYGTLRLRGRLDHRIAELSSRPLDRLDADTLDVLRLGVYQLTEMGGVPAYAAVSQSVELIKRSARSAAGFVNGVLQSLRRAGGESTFPSFEDDPLAHLSTWGSHPRWLLARWLARRGPDATRRLVEANNRTPQLYLRLLGDTAAARERLMAAGAIVEDVEHAPRAVRLVDAAAAGGVAAALEAAPVIVQDPAAGLVASWVGAPPGGVVLDLAAAPGGKALALAHDAPAAGPALVVAADVSAGRLARLVDNVARLERPPAAGGSARRAVLAPVVADARRPPFRQADAVLLDAPCTGTGTLRRHPDGRWRLRPDDVVALVALQAALLDAAAGLVKRGGLLVYATCSLEPEENEEQVSTFLRRHPEFRIEAGPPLRHGVVRGDGLLEVLPQEHGWDGAFAARLRRDG
jgi:16S rRNA (cytosine967-C5)-methyltransferase